MTETTPSQAFSPKVVIALILVGVFAFSGFTVLSVYAPELRRGEDGGAHALSKSAIGYAGVVALLKARGTPVVVTRAETPDTGNRPLRVLTPQPEVTAKELGAYDPDGALLIVLPKWRALVDPKHPGWVSQGFIVQPTDAAAPVQTIGTGGSVHRRVKPTRPSLHGAGERFSEDTFLPLGEIDRLQTVSGEGWMPELVDEEGRIVLGRSKGGGIWVLSDPDLLNTQGIATLENARAAVVILDALRDPEQGVAFDIALNGFGRSRNALRLAFEPPLVGATLCALAAALLMGLHAAVRFGPAARSGRSFAFGKRALIDNAADLIKAAHKEHELAPLYADLTEARTAKAAGERELDPAERRLRLVRMERQRRPADSLELLDKAAQAASTRSEAKSVAAKLFHWRSEMTRERG